ncbi:MAG: hypothetical protein AAF202_08460 [Pseudomonadota bacterium]
MGAPLSFADFFQFTRAKEICSSILLPQGKSVAIALPTEAIDYVTGEGPSGRVLRLSREEYRKKVLEESIPMDSILVLDEVDLEVDMPIVSGMILSQPLTLEGTHIQVLAEKMGIPLVYLPTAFENAELAMTSMTRGHYQMSLQEGQLSLNWSRNPVYRQVFERALPLDTPDLRGVPHLIMSRDPILYPREIVGDKFFPLTRLNENQLGDQNPPVVSLTNAI